MRILSPFRSTDYGVHCQLCGRLSDRQEDGLFLCRSCALMRPVLSQTTPRRGARQEDATVSGAMARHAEDGR